MDSQMYMKEVLRTYAGTLDHKEQLCLSALGLAGESGEVADSIKKALFQGHKIDVPHIAEELGDILWYLALGCNAIGYSLEDVMRMNIEKLRQRYPDGFESERSIHREDYK